MPTTAVELVKNVMEKKPSEFGNNFAELVQDRIRELVVAKRMDVAGSMFNKDNGIKPAVTEIVPTENKEVENNVEAA